MLTAAPDIEPGGWRRVIPAPKGGALLAEWGGPCEVPTAFLIDSHDGGRTLLGRGTWTTLDGKPHRSLPESAILGWVGDRGFAYPFDSGCGDTPDQPGIYRFRPDGKGTLVYPLRRAIAARLCQ